MVYNLPIKKKRRIRTITKSGTAIRHAQRSGPKHRRGQFIEKWNPKWRKRRRKL